MAFPFYPAGAITATLVLGATLLLFRMLLLALDRGAAELRGSIGAGLVRGVRAWSEEQEHAAASTATMPGRPANVPCVENLPPGVAIEELDGTTGIVVKAVWLGHS